MKRIYLDHAAATPTDKRVVEAMLPYFTEKYGNPGALHKEGVEAKNAVGFARKEIAECFGAHADEIIFTGSGTESNNLAITGLVKKYYESENCSRKANIVISEIEHSSIREVVKELERKNTITATYLSVSEEGVINPKDLKDAILENTILVSIMHANNEIGTIQPIQEVAKIVRRWRKDNKTKLPYLHTDACQSVNYLDIRVEKLGVDLLTFNGAKIYGPKGVGGLYVKRGVLLSPLICGGGHERGMRSGTENVAGIVGLAEALKITTSTREEEANRLSLLQDYFIDEIYKNFSGAHLNGSRVGRLPNNINITIPDIKSDRLIIELDAKGIACSAKSACSSRDKNPSHVIMALGNNTKNLDGSFRISMGRETTKKDLKYTVDKLASIIKRITKT